MRVSALVITPGLRERLPADGVGTVLELSDGQEPATLGVSWSQTPFLRGTYSVRDLWAKKDLGDTSTDFNFYTKRATLAGVYSSTLLYWLNDRSPGSEATWGFLDRRIDDVMKIEKLKSQVRSWTGGTARTTARR